MLSPFGGFPGLGGFGMAPLGGFGGGGGLFADFNSLGGPGGGMNVQTFSTIGGGGANVRSSSTSTKFINGKKITTQRLVHLSKPIPFVAGFEL